MLLAANKGRFGSHVAPRVNSTTLHHRLDLLSILLLLKLYHVFEQIVQIAICQIDLSIGPL